MAKKMKERGGGVAAERANLEKEGCKISRPLRKHTNTKLICLKYKWQVQVWSQIFPDCRAQTTLLKARDVSKHFFQASNTRKKMQNGCKAQKQSWRIKLVVLLRKNVVKPSIKLLWNKNFFNSKWCFFLSNEFAEMEVVNCPSFPPT